MKLTDAGKLLTVVLLSLTLLPCLSVQAQLWAPAVLNASFEDDVLSPGTQTGALTPISSWYKRTAYCFLSEQTLAGYPVTPYGANWVEFGNLSWVYQQIGTWQAGMQLEVSLRVGSIDGRDFPGLHVSLWAGGDPSLAADGDPDIPATTLESAVGAARVDISDTILPPLTGADAVEESVLLSTGTTGTPGEPLWLLVQSAGKQRVLIDNVIVIDMTEQTRVFDPQPGQNQTGIDPEATITWDAGNPDSGEFEINIGTDEACGDVLAAHNTGSDTFYPPPAELLQYATQYFWRVDIITTEQTHAGPVWNFTTGGKAANPQPASGQTVDRAGAGLRWTVDAFVDSCNVYFGEPDDLRLIGNYESTTVSLDEIATVFSVSTLAEGLYQWRVDTLDESGQLMVSGDIWDVVVPEIDPLVIDDFSDYADTAQLTAKWAPTGGAQISLSDLFAAMRFDYDNQSHASCTFDAGADWTAGGMDTLIVTIRGQQNNTLASIGVTLSDGTVTATETLAPTNALVDSQWTDAYVRLHRFSDAGLDLSNVVSLTIVVGDESSPDAQGSFYIDDIRLDIPGCVRSLQPEADIDGDCRVTLTDVGILMYDWLAQDFDVPAAEGEPQGLIACYTFDETAGTVAADCSPNGHHATVDANDISGVWQEQGRNNGCIRLGETTTVSIPAAVFADVGEQLTISFYVNGDPEDVPGNVDHISFSAGTAESETPWDEVALRLDRPEDYGGNWNHWAIVKDATENTMSIFHNGLLVSRTTDADRVISGSSAQSTVLSAAGLDGQPVKLDELTIFDRALSQQEIVYLAAGAGASVTQQIEPVLSESDLDDSGIVDIADFAVIAAKWLEQF